MRGLLVSVVSLSMWVLIIGLVVEPITRTTDLAQGIAPADRAALGVIFKSIQ